MPGKRKTDLALLPAERIARQILFIRGHRVILDAQLARLYGVTTKRLNEQVRRNADRFPSDFMFQLTWDVAEALRSHFATLNAPAQKENRRKSPSRSQFATLKRGRNIKYAPRVFTEHGVVMPASVLSSPRAVEVSVYVTPAFVQLQNLLATHREMAEKLRSLEQKLRGHDQAIANIPEAIQKMMNPPLPKRRGIGFVIDEV